MITRRSTDSPGAGEGGMHHSGGSGLAAEPGRVGGATDPCTPATALPWDPYEVWLRRVKEPRERIARTRAQERRAIEPPVPADLSDTARLRILSQLP